MTTAAAVARLFPLVALLLASPGCGLLFGMPPSAANIKLRKENAALRDQLKAAEGKASADRQVIAGLRQQSPTIPTLPAGRLDRLFTTHGLKLGRLTGGWDREPAKPGDEGLVVYVAPVDEAGDALKAAGSFVVEAFDLAGPAAPARVGRWTFDLPTARKAWRSVLFDYAYVLECPWQQHEPPHPGLTLKVTFVDELTQVPFTVEQAVKIRPAPGATAPAATGPTTAPADAPVSAPASQPASAPSATAPGTLPAGVPSP